MQFTNGAIQGTQTIYRMRKERGIKLKAIKSKHFWWRGLTLLLAVLMLFTCAGSALPAFAEESLGNAATVDSGEAAPVSPAGDDTDVSASESIPSDEVCPSRFRGQ